MSVKGSLDAGHEETQAAMRARLMDAMRSVGQDPDAHGLAAQVASQLLKVCEDMYAEQTLDEETWRLDLEAICDTLAGVMDTGSASVLAQTAGVLRKAEAMLEQVRIGLNQGSKIDDIVDRKPGSLVEARRPRSASA